MCAEIVPLRLQQVGRQATRRISIEITERGRHRRRRYTAARCSGPAVLIPTMLDAMMYVQQNDSQMVDQMVGSLGGYFTLSNRWGGQNFDTFNASDAWNATPYNTMFEDIYANFFDIEKSTSKSGHYYAMARLVRAAYCVCYGV